MFGLPIVFIWAYPHHSLANRFESKPMILSSQRLCISIAFWDKHLRHVDAKDANFKAITTRKAS